MAKRFIDTDMFKKQFIRGLEAPYKLLWLYIVNDCSHAGIWEVDLEVAEIRLGVAIEKEKALEVFGDKITILGSGSKWFLPDFITFQYGPLKENNRVHVSVISVLKKENLLNEDLSIKALISPLQGAKDKEKDKEQDKEMEKEKECQIEEIKIDYQEAELYPTFDDFWEEYDKKRGDREKIKKKWHKLRQGEREDIMDYIPNYKVSQPDKIYRKDPDTFLNNKSWKDEIIFKQDQQHVQGKIQSVVNQTEELKRYYASKQNNA